MSPGTNRPDIGIFFGRPERSRILAEKLRALGFPVTFYNSRGIPGTYVPVSERFPAALRYLLSTRHDLYLTSMTFVPALCVYLNAVLRCRPYVYSAVGLHSATYRDRARRWPLPGLAERRVYPVLMDRILAGASRIVCNSEYLQARLGTQFPRHAAKMTTIYNGINFERFTSGHPIEVDGIPKEAPKLLAVMTWNYEAKTTGARLLIDAMELVVARYPDARLIIAAKTSHQRYAEDVETYLATKPWQSAVRILYNQPDIPGLLASGDVFLYATPLDSNDSLPRAVLEAQAAGLPVVATRTAGCPEIVDDSRTGFVVPYETRVFSERVIDLLSDRAGRQRMGRLGQERVRTVFSWKRMVDGYAEIFRDVMTGPRFAPAILG